MTRPVVIAGVGQSLYALRDDGAVFVLVMRGHLLPDGEVVQEPFWAVCAPVPGTEAANDAEG